MLDTTGRYCNKLRAKLAREGKLALVKGTEQKGELEAQLENGVSFTVETLGRFSKPAFVVRKFYAASIRRTCTFYIEPWENPSAFEVETVGELRRALADLNKFLRQQCA